MFSVTGTRSSATYGAGCNPVLSITKQHTSRGEQVRRFQHLRENRLFYNP